MSIGPARPAAEVTPMLDKTRTFRFDATEQGVYARDGFIVREDVLSREECAAIAADCAS